MQRTLNMLKRRWLVITCLLVLAGLGGLGAVTYGQWYPQVRALVAEQLAAWDQEQDHDGHDHDGHDHGDHEGHDHAGHDHEDADSLELTQVARKNIGLTTGVVKPRTYVRTVSVPAMVVERPGRSQVSITAPLTGIVTRVAPIEGEAVEPGTALFELRLTHEDLVTAQRDFLRWAEELDVADREVQRLKAVGDGVIAGRRVLEQEYEKQKIEAALHAQRQGLLLHGLSEAQIDEILETRHLLKSLTVVAPPFPHDAEYADTQHVFHVQSIDVKPGQQVTAGELLGVLGDHGLLYVEGQAFEDDAERLVRAAVEGWTVDVRPVTKEARPADALQLKVLYVADHVDPETRALRFYLRLPNQLVRDEQQSGHRFVAWNFRPGQRMEVAIPIGEPWENQLVLPPEAVVEEGAEAFVFEQNGDHFDRVSVHVAYRDKDAVVVENDGTLVESTLALSGAYQMHLAIKNKAGGGVDPHAGHNH